LKRGEILAAMGFLALPLSYFVGFHLLPIAVNVWVSLHSGLPLIRPNEPFVGLKNFANLLHDDVFIASLKTSTIFSLGVTGSSAIIGLLLAMALTRDFRFRNVLRAVFVFPYMTSMAIITLIFLVIFNTQTGVLNFVLLRIGLGAVPWLSSPTWALVSVIIVTAWWGTGFNMVIYLAGLTAIPEEYFHAAKIDGAGALSTFWHVLLPLLAPTTFFVVVFSLINSFQAFIPPYVLTEGGPANATNLIVYYIYQVAFGNLEFAYGSAMSLVLFLIVFLVTAVMFRVWRGAVEY